MTRLVDELVGDHRVGGLLDAEGVPRRRVDLDRDEPVAELASQGLEAFRRHAPVHGEAEPEHAHAVGDPFLDPGEVVVADAERTGASACPKGNGTAG